MPSSAFVILLHSVVVGPRRHNFKILNIFIVAIIPRPNAYYYYMLKVTLNSRITGLKSTQMLRLFSCSSLRKGAPMYILLVLHVRVPMEVLVD